MATVNHSRLSNLTASDTGISFSWWWNLTRSMKKSGWKFKASSNGTTKISSADPAADQFGSGTISNAGAAGASITAISNGRATVTGLTGIAAADKGRFILFSGADTAANNNQHQIEEVLSTTSVRIDARNFAVVAPDANNGSITWSIRNPTGDVYSSFTGLASTVAWWCGQGPSILRIPITSASTGTFVRGENVVQATTGAEGELIGYIFSAGTGYLVVSPRLRGSGSGVHGWQTGNLITGAAGATVTQNGTAIDYVYEMVFIKPAAATSFHLLVGQFDTVADSAEMFSFCATQAGCTATVHPGGGGTGNAFGAHAWVMWGTNTTAGTGVNLPGTGTTYHRGHVICADAISEQGYTADGSWSLLYSVAAGSPTNGFCHFGFQKLNDTEEGDLAPYVTVNPGGTKTLYSENRTNAGTNPTVTTSLWETQTDTSRTYFQSWRRRGLSSESFSELEYAYLFARQSAVQLITASAANATKLVTSTDTTVRIREPLWVLSTSGANKMFKGTFKWIYTFSGLPTAVYGSDPAWVQIGSTVFIGPSDGTTWVLNA